MAVTRIGYTLSAVLLDFTRCTMYCIQHLKCKSVNYNENKLKCELCDKGFNRDGGGIDQVPEWKNYATPPKRKLVLFYNFYHD